MKNNFYLWFNEWKWHLLSLVGIGFILGVREGWIFGLQGIGILFMVQVTFHAFLQILGTVFLKKELNKIVFYELPVLIIWYVFLIYINLMVIVLMTLVSSLILSLAVVYIIKNNG